MGVGPTSRPQILRHLISRVEVAGPSGEETLCVRSSRRQVTLKGRRLGEFCQIALPLLDGRHTVGEIAATLVPQFTADDLEQFLRLLTEHRLLTTPVADSEIAEACPDSLSPQWSCFQELNLNPAEMRRRLAGSTVTVVGLGAVGSVVALSLAAANVGAIRCVDNLTVTGADLYLNPALAGVEIGMSRVDAVVGKIATLNPRVATVAHAAPLDDDETVSAVIAGSDLVVCCADSSLVSLFYKVNRACLRVRLRWTACAVSAFEGIVGPTIDPFDTPCYVCYKMRAVACAADPEQEFRHERFLDQRKKDDSATHENLTFTVGMVGNLVGLEALKSLTGVMVPASLGRIVAIDFLRMRQQKHVILRKPDCPVCGLPLNMERSAAADGR